MIIIREIFCCLGLILICLSSIAATTDSTTQQTLSTDNIPQQLHLLHQLAIEQLDIDAEKSLSYATDAWQIANTQQLPLALAQAQEDLARAYLKLGNYQHAKQYYQEVLNIYIQYKHLLKIAHANLFLAKIANIEKEYSIAGNYLADAEITLQTAENQESLAHWELQSAIRYYGIEQYSKAEDYCKSAIEFFNSDKEQYNEYLLTAYQYFYKIQNQHGKVQHLEKAVSNAWSTLIISSIIVAIILGLFYYRIIRLGKRHQLELQTKVKHHTKELQQANEALEEANAELKRFAYISSHDLKEPLRNIASFTTLIKRKLAHHLDQDTEEYFQFVSRNTRQIADLVTDIFEYSNLDERDVYFSYVDLNEVVTTAIKPLQNILETKNGTVVYNDLPTLYSNAGYLQLVFKNIIENGLKYNHSERPVVHICCKETTDYFHFDISDNGIGIPKEYHQYVFEMFRRLNNRKAEGSGLGLAICRKILRRLNGKISLSSTPNQGTVFHIQLPKSLHKSAVKKANEEKATTSFFSSQLKLNWL